MNHKIMFTFIILFLFNSICRAQFYISIDAQKDAFFEQLQGPDNGYIYIPHSDFLPLSGPKPSDDSDLSAHVWIAWDKKYFYLYAEVNDDAVIVNNPSRPQNDCIELKFDPDPKKKALTGIVNARLTALDSTSADNQDGVDNLYSEGNLSGEAVSTQNYARRITDTGYILEFRLAWEWIKTEDRFVDVDVGKIFGMSVTFHDNDSNKRDGSIQWSLGMADEVWNTPQLLGTMEFLADNKLKFIRQNSIDSSAFMGKTYLSTKRLRNQSSRSIGFENWKYHPGDNMEWANPSFDDRSWQATHPRILSNQKPESGWEGIGWFRIHIAVDSSLWVVPLGLQIFQTGASEVYLNGKLLFRLGKVGNSKAEEETYLVRNPKYIVFDRQENHVLAIRYSNFPTYYLNTFNIDAGFGCSIWEDLNSRIADRTQNIRTLTTYQMIFMVIPVVLAFLHVFLFLFYPRVKENLYFAICMFCWAFIVYDDFHGAFTTNLAQILLFARIKIFVIPSAIVFGLLTAYSRVYEKLPKQYIFFIIAGVVFTLWGNIQLNNELFGYFLYMYIAVAALEILRIFLFKGFEKEKIKWIIGIGFIALMLAVVYQILMGLNILEPIGGNRIVYVYGILALSIAMSIDISRNFAKTSNNLERQLIQVKELSQKTLEQERRSKEEEMARKLLDADNARKTQELEEARELQLSMLPKDIPSLPNLDIAAYMQPATEVGGDYYDFHVADDGTLTIAVGDATGHGMKAGTMVATIKGLFKAFGGNLEILSFFNTCTNTIKEMHLGNLYMAMMLVNIKDDKMIAASAGMPHILMYRNGTQTIEEIVLKGMPLGAHVGFVYKQKETELALGDTILLMSDGLPELFNDKLETLDYPQVKELFKEVAHKTPNEIIEHLNDAGEKWSKGRPQDDDITFVVLKFKNS